MSFRRPSLHSVVALSLLCMGLLALALTLLSSWIYREVAHDNRAAAVRDLLQTQTENITSELYDSQRILALRLAHSSEFRAAWRNGDRAALERQTLAALAQARPAAGGPAPLARVSILNAALEPLASAGSQQIPACPQMAAMAGNSSVDGAAGLCVEAGRASSTALVPLAGLDPGGYIEVVADPLIALQQIGNAADLALRIERPGGRELYQSDNWAAWSAADNALIVSHLAPADSGDPVLALRTAVDIGLLNRQLADTRDFVLLAASLIVAGAILAALVMVRRMLLPLRELQLAAERVSAGEGASARDFQPVEARGPAEIATPIRSFNQMVERIGSLLHELETEIGQRREAETAATGAKEEAEANAQRAWQEKEFSQITLESVVDAVIATDTAGRVNFMNPIAESLTGVSERQARGRPIDELIQFADTDGKHQEEGLVSSCLEGEATRSREERSLPHGSGQTLHVEYSAVPMLDTEGSVIGAVAVLHDVTHAHTLTERLTYQATHDALTGLINRYEFETQLQRTLQACADDGDKGVLCYLDLDQFKLVNDTCGHVAGDELLRQLARMLTDRLGQRGVLARLGGDEFGLLIHPSDIDHASEIAEQLRDAIQRFRFVWGQSMFSIGVSIGLVEITERTESTNMLLSAADTACYMAKDEGRNRVQVYQEDDEALVARHAEMHWVSEINRALEDDRFILYCQDIVRTGGGSPTHFEMLLRLRDEDGRIWAPGVFLSAAERYNLAPAIDQWVVRNAMQWVAASDVPEDAVYSINLSGRSLTEAGFLDFLLAELDQSAVRPQNLCFEVTETAAISNLSFARTFMESVRARGCRFSLDDFGSGLSSFTYLKNLPVDYLKIDGSFVRDIHRDPVHYAMVQSMNDVGHAMQMETIAEFVENEDVIGPLSEIGVDFLQGFRYSRPRPLDPSQLEPELQPAGAGSANPGRG